MKKLVMSMLCLISTTIYAESSGENTYKMACSNCHSPKNSTLIGAPAAFDKKDWRRRFKNAKLETKKNPDKYSSPIDYLLQNVKKGKGLMHHGGLCKESQIDAQNCSDESLTAAITYMSQIK